MPFIFYNCNKTNFSLYFFYPKTELTIAVTNKTIKMLYENSSVIPIFMKINLNEKTHLYNFFIFLSASSCG